MEILKTGRRRAGVYLLAGMAALGIIGIGENSRDKAEQNQAALDTFYDKPIADGKSVEESLDSSLQMASHELGVSVHGAAADFFNRAGVWFGLGTLGVAMADFGISSRRRVEAEPLPDSNTTEWIPSEPFDEIPNRIDLPSHDATTDWYSPAYFEQIGEPIAPLADVVHIETQSTPVNSEASEAA